MRLWLISLAAILAALGIAVLAVRPAPLYTQNLHVTRSQIRFDGERALWWTSAFVNRFPHRNAGGPNSKPAALWLADQLRAMGYTVTVDTWTVPLYGQDVELHNVIAVRSPAADGAVVLEAHLDHAPTTIQGADNDGSGVGILLTLAELLSGEQLQRPVVFLFADAEEYGMLGVRRFVATHPGGGFAAALTVDNAGKDSAFGTDVEMLGQGRGYTPLGLFRLLQDLAPGVDAWAPYPQDPVWQAVSRSVLVSFTDQGPLVRAGIPAINVGATGVWPHYHTPADTLDRQSAATLGHMGRLAEGFVRELEAGRRVDAAVTNYIYLGDPVPRVGRPGRYVPGWAIRLVQFSLILPFLLAVWQELSRRRGALPGQWAAPLLWLHGLAVGCLRVLVWSLPALLGYLSLPLLARMGLIPRFAFYPAPPKDPALVQVHWAGVAGFALAVAAGLLLAWWLAKRLPPAEGWGRTAALPALAALAIGVWLRNGYALIFLLPALYAWLPRRGRFLLFPLGGAGLAALLWLFGQRILHIGPYMGWYFLQMLAFGEVAPYAALAGCLVVGCGLALVTDSA